MAELCSGSHISRYAHIAVEVHYRCIYNALESSHGGEPPDHGIIVAVCGNIYPEEVVLADRLPYFVLAINGCVDVLTGGGNTVCGVKSGGEHADYRGDRCDEYHKCSAESALFLPAENEEGADKEQHRNANGYPEIEDVLGHGEQLCLLAVLGLGREAAHDRKGDRHGGADFQSRKAAVFLIVKAVCGHHSHN